MSRQLFVHLRLHSEFSIVDGIVRIDDALAAAAADGMGALALTDLANMFGMVKFYQAARKNGVKPVIGCDAWITNEVERDKPFRLLLLARSARAISVSPSCSRAPMSPINIAGARRFARRGWRSARRGACRAFRCDEGRRGRGAPRGSWRRRGESSPASGHRFSLARTTSSCSAPVSRIPKRTSRRRCGSRAASGCRWLRRTRCSSASAKTLRRTMHACALPKVMCSAIGAGRGRSRPSATSRRKPRWRRSSRICRKRLRIRSRWRSAAI